MEEIIYQKAQMLFERQRYEEAEKEFGLLLAQDPGSSYLHAMLGLCRLYRSDLPAAETHIREAIALDPASPFNYYILAKIKAHNDEYAEAEKNIREALLLNPADPDYHGLYAAILYDQKKWEPALKEADTGLALDPENLTCLNLRSSILIKLDRKEDAYETIREALNQDPNNAATHANVGWGLLEKGDHKAALTHFRQSLMLDPSSANAKAGLVEAMKARYLFYRLFLRYSFWIGNMQSKAQWGVIIGFYVGSRLLRAIAESVPALMPFVMPLVFLYSAFALSTWVIHPLSNLFLRINPYGRYALEEGEIRSSNFVGISLLTGVISGLLFLWLRLDVLLMLAVFGITMIIPFASMFSPASGRSQKKLQWYAAGMLLLGILAIITHLGGGELVNAFALIYLFAFAAYQWIANSMLIR